MCVCMSFLSLRSKLLYEVMLRFLFDDVFFCSSLPPPIIVSRSSGHFLSYHHRLRHFYPSLFSSLFTLHNTFRGDAHIAAGVRVVTNRTKNEDCEACLSCRQH